MSCQNSPVSAPVLHRLFLTSEFITQKSEYMGNLSFISSSIFIQLSNKLLKRGKKSWLSFTLNWVLFVNFCKNYVCLNHISL